MEKLLEKTFEDSEEKEGREDKKGGKSEEETENDNKKKEGREF